MGVNVERKQQVDFEKLGRPSFSNFLKEPWIIPQLNSKLQHFQDISTYVMIESVLMDKEPAAEVKVDRKQQGKRKKVNLLDLW